MATDEGVLGRTLGFNFARDGHGQLAPGGPERLYAPYVYQKGATRMNLVFRDHALSDLIGFVYSGMNAAGRRQSFCAQHQAGAPSRCCAREAMRWSRSFSTAKMRGNITRARAANSSAACTTRCKTMPGWRRSRSARPSSATAMRRGSSRWCRAHGSTPTSTSGSARPRTTRRGITWPRRATSTPQAAPLAPAEKRRLALEEILIAEGSDWNWWYGPEHHSANDRDFDELYRKHLSNVYQALGAAPPDVPGTRHLRRHGASGVRPQTAYIHPRVHADFTRYFDWIGAAMYTADRRAGAMHGKSFLLDAIYAGIDEDFLYGRLDFIGGIPQEGFELIVTCDRVAPAGDAAASAPGGTRKLVTDSAPASFRLELQVEDRAIKSWRLRPADSETDIAGSDVPYNNTVRATLYKNFEFQIPLALLGAGFGQTLRLRFSLWRDHLPVDALPVEGTMELPVTSEDEMSAGAMNYSAFS